MNVDDREPLAVGGNQFCLMQTGTGTVSGVITWRPAP
mgnify:CR=1 FL=1